MARRQRRAPAVHLVDKIVMRAVTELQANPRNSRTHSTEQVAAMVAAIRRFGFTMPLMTEDDGVLLAGHCRLEAARELGLDQVPTVDGSYMTAAERRAYVIADNQLAISGGEWDLPTLSSELVELGELDFDLTLLGFSTTELTEFQPQPPASPPAPEPPGSYREQYGVIVVCRDEAHQKEVFEALTAQGYEPRVVVT